MAPPKNAWELAQPGRHRYRPLRSVYRQAHVGADAHIGPAKRTVFTEIFRKSVIAQWVDVGIDPYRSSSRPDSVSVP